MVRTVTLSKCIIIIIVCRELPGNVVYSDGQNLGSVASYQCDNGLQQIQCETIADGVGLYVVRLSNKGSKHSGLTHKC